jgi:hypothetical protein
MNNWIKIGAFAAAVGMLTAPPFGMQAAYGADQNTVFAWNEIPQNQEVPIASAAFDRGGYQLQDAAGETIAIPYAQGSLCALKFALSTQGGGMYLVNEGRCPVLYMPANGCLENATVPDAYWYPFSHGYAPSEPVYLCVAPSWESYDEMAWYPGMRCYGGYESDNYIGSGAFFSVDVGLLFVIGGHNYNGWSSYGAYAGRHATNYHMAYSNQQVYGWAGRPIAGRSFQGGGRIWAHRTISGGQAHPAGVVSGAREFRGAGPVQGQTVRGAESGSTERVFRGAGPGIGGNSVRTSTGSPATRSYQNTTVRSSSPDTFRSARPSGGSSSFHGVTNNSAARSSRGSSGPSGGGRPSVGGDNRRHGGGGDDPHQQ